MGQVKGCHLVGSVPLADAEAVFRQCSQRLTGRLKRIPDGETGDRLMFTRFQTRAFAAAPELRISFVPNAGIASTSFTPEQIACGIEKLRKSGIETGYDTHAIESYQTFKRLRDEGAIARGTRLQVCIPTPPNAILAVVQKAFHAAVESLYQEAFYRAMRNIQNAIPHEDLTFQIDLAVDTAFAENLDFHKPWFYSKDAEMEQRKEYMVEYIVRQIAQVESDVEVGIHNCYGDMEHRHFKEPESLAIVAERGLSIFERTERPINFFQLPVSKRAMEKLDAFYEPMNRLLPKFRKHNTELLLGLVHYEDSEGTKTRIEAAKKAFGDVDFGISTECGWGRVLQEELENVMKISCELLEPVL